MKKHTPRRNSLERVAELSVRRQRQLARVPDQDSRITNYSKNSLPEYRKNYIRDLTT